MSSLSMPDFPDDPQRSALEKLRAEMAGQLTPMRLAQESLDRYSSEAILRQYGISASAFREYERIEQAKKSMELLNPIKQARDLMERFGPSSLYGALGIDHEQLMRQAIGLDHPDQLKMSALSPMSSFQDHPWMHLLQRDDPGMRATIEAANKLNSMGQYAHDYLVQATLSDSFLGLQDNLSAYLQPLGARSLQHLLDSLPEAVDFSAITDEEAREEVGAALGEIGTAASEAPNQQALLAAILEAVRRPVTPSWKQMMLLFILLPVIASIVGNILSTLGIDYIKARLSESEQEAKRNVSSRAIAAVGDRALLSDYRFVSTRVLRVRLNAKALSKPIGELRFGQVVRILRKENDFSLVEWSSEEGSVSVQGWVFSRYLEKFR